VITHADVMQEVQTWAAQNPGLNPFDAIRKQKLTELRALTGRPVIVYASDFLTPKLSFAPALSLQTMITLRDKDFLPVVTAVDGAEVDVLVQSPGGSAEATETLVEHLRSRFSSIRVLVPGTAKSAATMLAMSADEIVVDDLSELGPTDPQMVLNGRYSPAGAIAKQFQRAVQSLKDDPASMPAWLPVLQMYGPSLLVECEHHVSLSQELVGRWLQDYMFRGDADREAKANAIAEWLATDENFRTHARRVGIAQLEEKGVKILDMRTDENLQRAVRGLYYAIMITFDGTGVYKLFENSEGKTLAMNIQVQVQQVPQQVVPAGA
jgi:hypothetical protein